MEVDTAAARKIVEEFLAAALSGRTDALVRMLADDAISVGDGGGVLFSLPRPVTGAVRVARFLRGLFKPSAAKWSLIGGKPELFSTVVNGVPALVLTVEDRLVGVVSLEVTADGIAAVHAQVNPAKLDRAAGQWGISEHGEPLTVPW
ncbi:hypothetical protein [Amycolatopsis sp. WAC 04169]|uniref:hypothetical protein n=1 Tax=Amycolatopsis sp. WAC 04169 TaxID=2203197 RepID=UPI002696A102